MDDVAVSEERRRRRREGDPPLSDADRELLARITTGDMANAFQDALDATLMVDPQLAVRVARRI
jgi:hypothetical protein